jgi:hypothetical protein
MMCQRRGQMKHARRTICYSTRLLAEGKIFLLHLVHGTLKVKVPSYKQTWSGRILQLHFNLNSGLYAMKIIDWTTKTFGIFKSFLWIIKYLDFFLVLHCLLFIWTIKYMRFFFSIFNFFFQLNLFMDKLDQIIFEIKIKIPN